MGGLDDAGWMASALSLARRGLGTTFPNPSVGCVLVRDGVVVGRGRTRAGGRPHAETEALAQAGERARGAVAYVSLEPCDHHGQTPPCSLALIRAGVARVVVACEDPDPRVSGAGMRRLREAGIEVRSGVLAEEARELNAGFFMRLREGRPLVTLKLATTLDGRIAVRTGESRWITGEVARAWGHGLRARSDAILVGLNTALADDPELTCRLPGLSDRSPARVVLDSRLRLSLTAKLVRTAGTVPTLLLALPGGDKARSHAFRDAGVEVVEVPPDAEGVLDVGAALRALGDRGLTRLLVEGGARVAGSLLRARLVDRLEWFRAPCVMGGDGLAAVVGFGVDALADAPGFVRLSTRRAGLDLAESYARRA